MSDDDPKLDPKVDAWRRQGGALTNANAKYRNSDQKWVDQRERLLRMADAEDACESVSVGGLAFDMGFTVTQCESPEHAEAIVREMGSMEGENNRLKDRWEKLKAWAESREHWDSSTICEMQKLEREDC